MQDLPPGTGTGQEGPAPEGTGIAAGRVRVIVDVTLKPEIYDPQGRAITGAAWRLGFGRVGAVRQGKRFEVEIDGPADGAALAEVGKLADALLANPVIEDFFLRAAPEAGS